jgi:hypothetical protein
MKSENNNNLPSPINVGGHIYLSVVYTIFPESTDYAFFQKFFQFDESRCYI